MSKGSESPRGVNNARGQAVMITCISPLLQLPLGAGTYAGRDLAPLTLGPLVYLEVTSGGNKSTLVPRSECQEASEGRERVSWKDSLKKKIRRGGGGTAPKNRARAKTWKAYRAYC